MLVVVVFEHPVVGFVYEYVIVCIPTPAVAGLNTFALTPGPLNVPPAGEPTKVVVVPFIHCAETGVILKTGKASTVAVVVSKFEHPVLGLV